jgi:hypothetical protein
MVSVYVVSKWEKRGLITSSTFLRYRQTPNYLKRVKAHAIRREPFTSVLDSILVHLPIFKNKNKKQTLLPYVFMSLSSHRHYDLLLIILTITDCKDKK